MESTRKVSEIISEAQFEYVSSLDDGAEPQALVDSIQADFGVNIQCRLHNDAISKNLETKMALGYQTSQSVFHIVKYGSSFIVFDGSNRLRCLTRLILANLKNAGTQLCNGYTKDLLVRTIICPTPKVFENSIN